jgi:phage terminase large subunit
MKERVQFTEQAEMLFRSKPYKVMYGGRGGAKSWDMARALLVLGANRKLFILCGREIQKSIAESVHKLLSDQINTLCFGNGEPLSDFYSIIKTEIVGRNDTRFVFAGLRNNIAAIKSMEGIDICWVTEAATISDPVWETLLPTIRRDPPNGPFKQGSEIWIDFNPELSTDATYKRWVLDADDDIAKAEVNWRDNPWFPAFLRKQMEKMKKNDYDSYLTVWEGKTRKTLAGAIYAKELAKAIMDNRVSPNIKLIRNKPVDLAFDLGRADMTSIWFMQQAGTEHMAIDHYRNCGEDFAHYIEVVQQKKYLVGKVYLPHDARHKHISAKQSVERQAKDAWPGEGRVKIVPNIGIMNGINATRALFPRLSFNEKMCEEGLQALQHYQYGVNPETQQRTKEPLHNWASHDADALRYYAVMLRDGKTSIKAQESPPPVPYEGQLGWMN